MKASVLMSIVRLILDDIFGTLDDIDRNCSYGDLCTSCRKKMDGLRYSWDADE